MITKGSVVIWKVRGFHLKRTKYFQAFNDTDARVLQREHNYETGALRIA
jgi:hypothetical protein